MRKSFVAVDRQHHSHSGANRGGGGIRAAGPRWCAAAAPAGGRGRGPQFTDLPAFCRVQATLKPTSDSDIKMELWLPASADGSGEAGRTRWNGKFRGTGNGGLGGGAGVNANALANGLRAGYAAAGHNTGHDGDSSYALDHPEKIKDFGYRSTHEMTVASKALIKAFYGTGPRLSYMAEGGGGTIAALSSAQRYPEDYDTIAVTGMSSYLTRHTFGSDVDLAGDARGRRELHPAGQIRGAARRRARHVATRSTGSRTASSATCRAARSIPA